MEPAVATRPREDPGHMARHMMQIMDKLLKSGFSPGRRTPDWTPAVDISELEDRYEIIVELAGVRREDIELHTEGTQLVVTGWRGDPGPRERLRIHQMEIEEGQFQRRIFLPEHADVEGITARFREGLLRIQVPKQEGRRG